MSDREYSINHASGMPVDVSPAQYNYAMEEMRSQQQLGLAIVVAAPVALLCAMVWAFVTVRAEFQIGWMAVGVALLIGMTIRLVGRGFDPIFGVVGAAMSLVSCALGNLLAGCSFVAAEEGVAVMDVLMNLNGPFVVAVMSAMFSPIDLVFYGLAVYEGYRLSIHSLSA